MFACFAERVATSNERHIFKKISENPNHALSAFCTTGWGFLLRKNEKQEELKYGYIVKCKYQGGTQIIIKYDEKRNERYG